ncbi:3-hydroxyacyl-CoA dehydrogenase NAD-binding domain-containing protein [Lentzea flava]|uniref:Oxidoreductase n=1 Tax=Lentzea flava TaxID=103732 RepID=A0ABQ2UGV2_9PSEU|nr:3-hydroxyacyl-CoA dehydrogenase NAD-binding domain-containing protein [Lentzea flava]MCP2198972.1 3-hydroxybutyryl-CoA dehydrogenase [Lentzea flava]GGU32563.1 oxidoreductase [Lentzea flava]
MDERRTVIGVLGTSTWVPDALRDTGHDVVQSEDLDALVRADIVIDTTPDVAPEKAALLQRLDAVCPLETLLVPVVFTSSVEQLAALSGRPSHVVGLRVPLPPPAGGGAELLLTPMTSAASASRAARLLDSLGLTPLSLGAGVASAARELVFGYLNRAAALAEEGYASRSDIDTAMRLGCGLPAGPLELLDRIGLDVAQDVLVDLMDRTGDKSFHPTGLLRELAEAGRGFREDPAESFGQRDSTDAAVRRVGVVGAGTMACGIAEVAASAGIDTVLVARDAAKASRALDTVQASLTKSVRRGRISAETKQAALDRLSTVDDVSALSSCDLVIEAVAENTAVKRAVFGSLDRVCKPGAVLATTTSSLPVSMCAEATSRPESVVGLHFFNPAPAMKLVELAFTDATGSHAARVARAFCAQTGKTSVDCHDRAGFIVNFLLFPYLSRAIGLLERGVSVAELDAAVEAGFGYPMGPFKLLDTIGLDVSLAIQRRLYDTFGTAEHEPSPVLEAMVAAGWLGRKNGRGFTVAP